jgi:hypothetical protein
MPVAGHMPVLLCRLHRDHLSSSHTSSHPPLTPSQLPWAMRHSGHPGQALEAHEQSLLIYLSCLCCCFFAADVSGGVNTSVVYCCGAGRKIRMEGAASTSGRNHTSLRQGPAAVRGIAGCTWPPLLQQAVHQTAAPVLSKAGWPTGTAVELEARHLHAAQALAPCTGPAG